MKKIIQIFILTLLTLNINYSSFSMLTQMIKEKQRTRGIQTPKEDLSAIETAIETAKKEGVTDNDFQQVNIDFETIKTNYKNAKKRMLAKDKTEEMKKTGKQVNELLKSIETIKETVIKFKKEKEEKEEKEKRAQEKKEQEEKLKKIQEESQETETTESIFDKMKPTGKPLEIPRRLKKPRHSRQQKKNIEEEEAKAQKKKQKETQKKLIKELAEKLEIEEKNQEEFKSQIKKGTLLLNKKEYNITNENINEILVIVDKLNKIQKIKILDFSNQKNLLVPVEILQWGKKEGQELIYNGTITSLIAEIANLFAYKDKDRVIKALTKQIEQKKLVLNNEKLKITDENIDKIFEKIIKINEVKPITVLAIQKQKNLTKVPKEIEKLEKLEKLELNNNNIKTINFDIDKLTTLKTLNLSDNTNLVVPEKILVWVAKKKGLELLINGTKTQIRHIQTLIEKLNVKEDEKEKVQTNLNNQIKKRCITLSEKNYNITDKNIDKILEIIIKINEVNPITMLAIQNQENLTKVPKEIGKLENLTILSLNNNQIMEIPEEIINLSNLNFLNLENNPKFWLSTKILETLNNKKLTSFDLDETLAKLIFDITSKLLNKEPTYDEIISFVEQIEKGKLILNDKKYDIYFDTLNNILEQIIKIDKFKPIKTLVISDQKNLNGVPENIGELTNLEILGLCHNNIVEIPVEIENLKNLEKLWLHNNEIKKTPKEIGNLKNLKQLWLDNNTITKIDFDINKLTKLEELKLTNNPKLLLSIISTEDLNNKIMFEATKNLIKL